MSKILVIYYSYEGSTKMVAQTISKYINSDIMEIKPKDEMKAKGFGKFIWGGRQVVMGKTPELIPFDKNLHDYDTIFLGSPIWAGTFTPAIKTLLEKGQLKGKKVAYFYTHRGGAGKAKEKGKAAIEMHNEYISSIDFVNPKKDIEAVERKVKSWVDRVLTK